MTVDVPENLIHKFTQNQPAKISWYSTSTSLSGFVTEIGTLPHLIKQTYSVTFSIDPDEILKTGVNVLPGKAVTLTTRIGELSHDFCVPYSAIVGDQGNKYIYLVEEQQNSSKAH